MLDRILKATREAREAYEENPTEGNALDWAFMTGRLMGTSKKNPAMDDGDTYNAVHSEIDAYRAKF